MAAVASSDEAGITEPAVTAAATFMLDDIWASSDVTKIEFG